MPTFDDHDNLAYSTVIDAPFPASSGASLTIQSGDGVNFPAPPFQATVWPTGQQPTLENAEVVQVNAIIGDILVLARAQSGTNARAITSGDQIANTITAKPFVDLENAINQKTYVTVGTSVGADFVATGINDQTVINAAFDSLPATGGTVFLKEGTYKILTPGIKIPSNCQLIGSGWGTIIKRDRTAAFNGTIHNKNASILNQTATNTGIIIANLKIDGNSAQNGGNDPRDNVWLKGCDNCLVSNLYIVDSPDSAITLDTLGFGKGLTNSNNCIVRNCIIDTTADIGIYCSDGENCLFEGNIIRNTSSYGLRVIRRLSGGAQNNTIIGNKIFNCGQDENFNVDGIILDDGDLAHVIGNFVIGSGRNGINIQGSYFNVSGNHVDLSDAHGIFVTGVGRGTITGNTVYRSSQSATNTYSGITLNAASEVTVTGNRTGDTGSGTRQKYGVEEMGGSNSNVIIGNSVFRNATGGVIAIGAATKVDYNAGQDQTVSKTTNYSVAALDRVLSGDATSAELTFLLGTASGSTDRRHVFKRTNSGGNRVVIGTSLGQTIDGIGAYSLDTQYAALTVGSNGSNWQIHSSYGTVVGFTTSTSSTSSSTSSTSSSISSTSTSSTSSSTSSSSSTSVSVSSTSSSSSTSLSTSTTVIAFG